MKIFSFEIKKSLKMRSVVFLLALLTVFNITIGFFTQKPSGSVTNEKFESSLDRIIYQAKVNYSFIENKESVNGIYQVNVVKRYNALYGLDVEHEVRGFYSVLSSVFPYISALVLSLWLAIQLSLAEFSSDAVLLSFKRRRIPIIFSKLGVLALTSLLSVVFFTLCYSVSSLFNGGFAGGASPVQSIAEYMYSPYKISVIGALATKIIINALMTFFAALLIYFASSVFRKFIPSLVFVVLLTGLEFLLKSQIGNNTFSFFFNFNFRTFMGDSWLCRYNGMKI
ncbi:MAG: hypothetical protein ACI4QR_03950, partial [Eubacteriales bacterium]